MKYYCISNIFNNSAKQVIGPEDRNCWGICVWEGCKKRTFLTFLTLFISMAQHGCRPESHFHQNFIRKKLN